MGQHPALSVRCCNQNLRLSHIEFPENLFGSIKDTQSPRDYIRCAQSHCQAGIVSTIDIKSFFDYVSRRHVENIFENFFKYSKEVSCLLADLTTYDNKLPQGAPTSPALANLVFFEDEPRIIRRCLAEDVRYTRYLDDIVLSHKSNSYPIERRTNEVKKTISQQGFEVNDKKTVTKKRNTEQLKVLGIVVNFATAGIPKEERRKIRSAVKDVEQKASKPNSRKTSDYHKIWHKTSGRLSKLQRLNYSEYKKYRLRMRKILPLADDKEYFRLERIIANMERNTDNIQNTHAFNTILNRVKYRAGILGRSEKGRAKTILDRLKAVRGAIE
jgi:RNA-directed DNA polymerase